MRKQSQQIAGVQVEIRFPEYVADHDRYGAQVVTVIIPGHEEPPLHYVIGRSQLPEGAQPDSAEGQDAALEHAMPQIEKDVPDVRAGKEVDAQKMRL